MADGQRLLNPAWRRPARIAWLILAALALAVLAAAVPAYYRLLSTACAASCAYFQLPRASAQALLEAGLSLQFYARWITAVTILTVASAWVLASVLFWQKDGRWMTAYMSFALLGFGLAFFSVLTTALVARQPAWRLPVGILEALGLWMMGSFGLLFPDGHFVPHWSWPLALVAGGVSLVIAGNSSLAVVLLAQTPLAQFLSVSLVSTVAAGAAAQVYRYRRVSGAVERQQAKWIVFGFTLFVVIGGVFYLAGMWAEPFRRPGLANALYFLIGGTLNAADVMLLLACFGLAILRYRLWDIDVIIHRTLIYSVLSAVLALAYLGSILVLQNLFQAVTGRGQDQLVTVISTLAIWVLFVPLRRRVQGFIDRRFYRRKYDAARILAQFGANARDEVELEALTTRLIETVDAAMRPAHTSLWLNTQPGLPLNSQPLPGANEVRL